MTQIKHLGNVLYRGGLKDENKIQRVSILFYPKEAENSEKIVLSHAISDYETGEPLQDPVSLRFNSYGELHSFMALLLEAKVLIGKEQGTLNAENYNFFIDKEIKLINKVYRGSERSPNLL